MSRSTGTLSEQLAAQAAAAPRERVQVVAGNRPVSQHLFCRTCKKKQVFAFGWSALYLWVSDLERMAEMRGWQDGVCLDCRLKVPVVAGTQAQAWLVVAYGKYTGTRALVSIELPGPVPQSVALATAVQRLPRMVRHQVLPVKKSELCCKSKP